MTRKPPIFAANWPFDVRRSPVFYGWVIWFMSTVGFLMSIPGQTMGMAVFTDPFIDVLGLSRTQLSVAYFFGTVASAACLTRAGRWYDLFGARTMILFSAVLLALTLGFISGIDVLATRITRILGWSMPYVTFALILVGYFGVRLAGQGVMTSASRNVLLSWFERRRGLVSGVRGVFVSLGFSLAPLLLAMLIGAFGWRGALWLMAATLCGFALFVLVFLRDTPSACGLQPDGVEAQPVDPAGTDGDTAHTRAAALAADTPDATLAEARRSPVFWIYSLGMSLWALFGTAVTYHVVAIFAEAGRDATQAFGYFLPNAIVATVVNMSSSWVADRAPLKPFLVAMIAAFLVGTCGLMNLESQWGYWLMVVGFGGGGGLWGTLSNLAFVRHFGLLHLGEISGLNTSVTVFASAVGPVLFSLGRDWTGTYQGPAWLCVGGLLILLAAAVRVRSTTGRGGSG